MRITTALCLCLTLLTTAAASAAIYKTVDENGRTVYTDNPPANKPVEAVKLPELNTQPPVTTPSRPAEKAVAAPVQYRVSIAAPAEGTQIPMGQHEVPVSLDISPSLRDGAYVQILLNGEPFGPTFQGSHIVLTKVYRGEHQLQAAIYSAEGEELARSNSVTLYVQRQSVNRLPSS